MKLISSVSKFLIFSNIYVAVPLCCLTILFHKAFELNSNWNYYLFVYFSSLFLYCFHRLIGLKKSDNIITERWRWVKNNYSFILIISIISGGLSVNFFYTQLSPSLVIYYLIPVLLSFGYSLPVIKTKNRAIRFRDLGVIKPIFISTTVCMVTAFIPLAIDPNSSISNILSSIPEFGYLFLFVLAITIPFDIRDVEIDLEQGTQTIPVKYGIKTAKTLAFISLILAGGFLLLSNLEASWKFSQFITLFTSAIIISLSGKNKSEFFYSIFMEGTMIAALLYYLLLDFLLSI